ncbi:hypothetical protein [Salinicola rhizosphaerae]|uniref:DUF2799 domain-containing protein n=1 Tax=Salinicola rhizosphaerae TaxID=1443141 RepID=A0ABQ3DS41_9GAMM|nr:hypothetical protein [Salinicola rhizosphaerae]GHB08913.1 hypothetical protein GCM10009038_03040 [Salinicola rhizosphaerae]
MSRFSRNLLPLPLVVVLLLAGCVSATPRLTATNFIRDSRTCERQTHQIAGEPEYQICMSRLGWPDPQTQAARIQANESHNASDQGLFNEAINGLQFGLQWDLDPD